MIGYRSVVYTQFWQTTRHIAFVGQNILLGGGRHLGVLALFWHATSTCHMQPNPLNPVVHHLELRITTDTMKLSELISLQAVPRLAL